MADALSVADIEAAERRVLPAALFSTLTETGITAMLTPEDQGGVDASLADAVDMLRVAGAAAAPGPLLETLLGRSVLARAGLEAPEGAVTLAFLPDAEGPRPGERVWAGPPVLYDVPWGGLADRLLVILRGEGAARVVVSRPSDWTVAPGADAAGEPRDRLSGKDVAVEAAEVTGFTYDELFRAAAVLRAGQILGALEWAFQRTTEYAMERKQFGKELGRFQVVQQMLAELADNALASAAITEAAAEGRGQTLVASARSRLGDAADIAITVTHQVHGAIGFSREYALNYRTRRLMAWRDDYGSVPYWRRTLAGEFVGLTREAFWPAVADPGLAQPV
jgi:acyl-CoA dehydrogenase